MQQQSSRISVLGAGSWGSAIAVLLAKNGHPVRLWGRNAEKIAYMRAQRQNPYFLPDIDFPPNLQVLAELDAALVDSDVIIIAVPSHAFANLLAQIKQVRIAVTKLCWLSKGLEPQKSRLLHTLVETVFDPVPDYAVISGPTFAREVASGLPTAVTIAAKDCDYARQLADIFHNEYFRPYLSTDIIGVEIGGAVKNVLAIAAGIADGLGFGANTRAALITRGLVEMRRLATRLGAQEQTLMGLSGMGDLLLTCTDNQSRNRRLGLALGQGKTLAQAKQEISQVIEGIQTAREIYHLAGWYQIDMPIVNQVYAILYEHTQPQQAVQNLLTRNFTYEQRDNG